MCRGSVWKTSRLSFLTDLGYSWHKVSFLTMKMKLCSTWGSGQVRPRWSRVLRGLKMDTKSIILQFASPISPEWMLGDNLDGVQIWGVSKTIWELTFDLGRRKQAWFVSGCLRQEGAVSQGAFSSTPPLSSPPPWFYLALKERPSSHTNYTEVYVVDVTQQRTLIFHRENIAYCLSDSWKGGKSEVGGIRSTPCVRGQLLSLWKHFSSFW